MPETALLAPAEQTLDAEVQQTAESLIKECSEIRVRVNWFGTTSKVDEEQALEMLKESGADRKSVSISKRLLSTKNDAMTAAKEARKAIQDHVNAWTVPMVAIRAADTGTFRKDAGVRLIQKKDMEAFDERLQYLTGILMTAIRRLQTELPEIKKADRDSLKALYRESDYPTDVTKLVSVEVSFKSTAIDLDWEQMCPAIYARERAQAQLKMNEVVENAALEFSRRFVSYVKQVVDQLGNRLRLNPTAKSKYLKYKDAEVVERLTHEEDPEIPEGQVQVQVRRQAKKGEKISPEQGQQAPEGKSVTEWLEPMTLREFDTELRPYETAERKKVFASSIDNIKIEMEAFLNIGAMLGPYQGIVSEGVEAVRKMLTRAASDQDSEKIASSIRSEDFLRNEMRRTLDAAANLVRDNIGDAKRRRREIDMDLVGKVG